MELAPRGAVAEASVRQLVSTIRCRWWDWRHGVRTCGEETSAAEDISTARKESLADATFYMPTHPKLVYRILQRLNPEPHRYDFVDMGSGKGRVVLIASEFPFRQVIGVEFDRRLHATAEENIRSFRGARRCGEVRAVCMDAADYRPLARDTIYFLFFPFRQTVMELVLAQLCQSVREGGHDCFVVYVNPELGFLIDATGTFVPHYQDEYCRIWRAQYARG